MNTDDQYKAFATMLEPYSDNQILIEWLKLKNVYQPSWNTYLALYNSTRNDLIDQLYLAQMAHCNPEPLPKLNIQPFE